MATLTGTSGADTLTGTADADTITGAAGNDTLKGNAGNDTINGGSGNDTIDGDAGNDTIRGGIGDDTINGGADNDVLRGEFGHDTINGGDGDDTIDGGSHNDTLNGGAGVDFIRGGKGRDKIDAGTGADAIVLIGKSGVADYTQLDLQNSGGAHAGVTASKNISSFLNLSDINNVMQGDAEAGETIDGGADADVLHIFGNVNLSETKVSNVENIYLNGELQLKVNQNGKIAAKDTIAHARFGHEIVRTADGNTPIEQDIFNNNTTIYGSDKAVLRLSNGHTQAVTIDLSAILGTVTAANGNGNKLHNIKHLIIESGVTVRIDHVQELANAGIQVITGGGIIDFGNQAAGTIANAGGATGIANFATQGIVINPVGNLAVVPNAQQIQVQYNNTASANAPTALAAADLDGGIAPNLDTNVVRGINNLDNAIINTLDNGGTPNPATPIAPAGSENAATVAKLQASDPSTLILRASTTTVANNEPIDFNDTEFNDADGNSVFNGIEHLIIEAGVTLRIDNVSELRDAGIKVVTGGGTIDFGNNGGAGFAAGAIAGQAIANFAAADIAITPKPTGAAAAHEIVVQYTNNAGTPAVVRLGAGDIDGAGTPALKTGQAATNQAIIETSQLTIDIDKTDTTQSSANDADGINTVRTELQKFRDNTLIINNTNADVREFTLADLNNNFQMRGIEHLEIGDKVVLKISSVEELHSAGVRAVTSTSSNTANSGVLKITGTDASNYDQFAKLGIAINVDNDPIADRTTNTDDGVIVLKHDGTQLKQADLGSPSSDTTSIVAEVSAQSSNSAPNANHDLANLQVGEDTTLTFNGTVLTSNDTDTDGDALTVLRAETLTTFTSGGATKNRLDAAHELLFEANGIAEDTIKEDGITANVYAQAVTAYANAIRFGFGKEKDATASKASQHTDKGAEDLAEDSLKATITKASTGETDQTKVDGYITDIKGAFNHVFDELKSNSAGKQGKAINDSATDAVAAYKAARDAGETIDEARLNSNIFTDAQADTSNAYAAIMANAIANHAAAIEDIAANFKLGGANGYVVNRAIPNLAYGDDVIATLNGLTTGSNTAAINTAVSNALKVLAVNAVVAEVAEFAITQGSDEAGYFDNARNNTVSVEQSTQVVTFKGTAAANGNMFFEYVVQDENGAVDAAFSKVVVNNDNDAPLINNFNGSTAKDIIYTKEDNTYLQRDANGNLVKDANGNDITKSGVLITKEQLLANDFDTEDGRTTSNGVDIANIKITNIVAKDATAGHQIIIESYNKDENGVEKQSLGIDTFRFVSAPDFFGTAEFTYTVQDSGGLTATGDSEVRVRGEADAPTAVNDVVNISTLKQLYSSASGADTYVYENNFASLLANDTDVDGDTFYIGSLFLDNSALSLGTLTIDQANQTFSFKAGPQFDTDGDNSGSVNINYTLADTTGLTSVGKLTLTLTNVSTDLGGDLKVLSLASIGDRLKLSDANSINGIKINGIANNDGSGNVVTSIGDINKDGKMDFAISAKDGNATKGAVYVVYGTGNKFTSDIDLSSLDGKNGFVVKGSDNNSDFGSDIAKLGDFNGDGVDDFVVGANGSDRAYVIYGKENQSISSLDLANWTAGTDGVVIKGSTTVETGDFVTGLDINQDGYSDVVVNNNDNDEVFVVFGYNQSDRTNTQKTTIDLTASSIATTDAIKIKDFNGADSLTRTTSLSSGDVNKDGKADLIIGTSKGETYVVFGSNTAANWNADFDLTPTGAGASLSSARAVKITGTGQNAVANTGATFIGDINNSKIQTDGFTTNTNSIGDIFISTANNHAYVVYGKAQASNGLNNDLNINLANLTAAQGFKITGSSSEANTVIRTAKTYGDFNGDGVNDILVSESTADPNGNANAGNVYVIYGNLGTSNNDSTRSEVKLADLNGKDGFRLEGVSAGDLAGGAISFVSDLNNDTLDDIIISATGAEGGGTNRGESYIVYGFSNNNADTNINPYVVKGLALTGNAAATVFQTFTTTLNPSDLFKDEDVNDTLTLSITNPDGTALPSYITFNSSTNQLQITSRSSQTIELRITATDSQGAKTSFVGTVQVSGNQAQLNLASLNSHIGKTFEGENAGDEFGIATSSIGDINGDGYDDFVIGANGHDAGASGTGKAYVVFGNQDGKMMGSIANIVSDTNDDGTAAGGKYGFTIKGSIANQNLGVAVSSAGDINGDGIDDLIIGASGDDGTKGKAYVIYGQNTSQQGVSFGSSVDLTTLNTGNNPKGFSLTGESSGSNAGVAVSNIGDYNGDGVDDYAVSATGFDSNKGIVYVVYGQDGVNSADVNFATFTDASKGFRIAGAASNGDLLGASISGAGDVNGDGIDDMIVSVQTGGTNNLGEAYIIYGNADPQTGLSSGTNALLLSSVSGNIGTKLVYSGTNGGAGRSVSSAGDLNGDGFADVIVSASFSAGSNGNNSGFAHVVYGSASLGSSVALASLNGDNGFKINGAAANDQFSRSVSNIGDFNGDGFDDIVVGANAANSTGRAYVIFGTDAGFAASTQLSTLNGNKGFMLAGAANGDLTGRSVSDAGDVNGDGFDDILVGANQADPGDPARSNAGKAYIVYGFDAYNTTAITSTGTDGKDKLNGSSVADNLSGGKDDDILRGGNGDDMLKGEDGKDTIYGGRGNDYIDGGALNDIIHAGEGNDMKLTTQADGTIKKSAGVMGGSGDDKIYGEDGNDWIDGGTGKDTIKGGDGMDIVDGGDGNDTIHGGNGNDMQITKDAQNNDVMSAGLKGGKGNDTIYGDRGNDWLDGGEGNDMLYGGAGMDRIDGGTGNDTIRGGDGNDAVFNSSGAMSGAGLKGDAGDDKIYGEAGNDYLMGGDGNDMLDGGAGNDKLHGGEGKDTIDGGAGDDTIELTETTAAEDIVKFALGSGKDEVKDFVLANDFVRVQTATNLVVDAFSDIKLTTTNTDTKIEFKNSAGSYNADDYITLKGVTPTAANFIIARTLANSGVTFDATANSGALKDVRNEVTGGTGADTITGGDKADTLISGGGGGTIKGGDGHDIITGGAGNDTLEGGVGNDTISASEGTNTLKGDAGNDTITGGKDNDTIEGGAGDDIIKDSAGANTIKGDAGNDTITGGSGNDTIEGGADNDIITDAAGTNTLKGDAGNDTITGGSGVDTIDGGDGDDTIKGMAGNDIITAGKGKDTIYGGAGDDQITLTEATPDQVEDIVSFGFGDGKDQITGFSDSKDFIRLELSSNLVVTKLSDITKTSADLTAANDVKVEFKDATGNNNADNFITLKSVIGNNITELDFILARTLDNTGVTFDASTADLKNFRHEVTGGTGNDKITGGDKNDTLNGNAGNDELIGGDGVDTLNGGEGNDTLTGGGGFDSFIFEKGAAGQTDTITDFNVSNDEKITIKGFTKSDGSAITNFNDLTKTVVGGNIEITIADNADYKIILQGSSGDNANITADDFAFM